MTKEQVLLEAARALEQRITDSVQGSVMLRSNSRIEVDELRAALALYEVRSAEELQASVDAELGAQR